MLAALQMFGDQLLMPVPDIDRSDCFVCARRQPAGVQRQPDDGARRARAAEGDPARAAAR
jgi:hypothetical protein